MNAVTYGKGHSWERSVAWGDMTVGDGDEGD